MTTDEQINAAFADAARDLRQAAIAYRVLAAMLERTGVTTRGEIATVLEEIHGRLADNKGTFLPYLIRDLNNDRAAQLERDAISGDGRPDWLRDIIDWGRSG